MRPPAELDAFFAGLVVFESEGGHVLLIAAVKDFHGLSAEAASGAGGVNRGIACADDHGGAAHVEIVARFVTRDELESVNDGRMIFVGDAQFVYGAEADAEEDGVEFLFELNQLCGVDFFAEAEFHAEGVDHFDFTEAVGGAQFVFGDAVGVKTTGKRLPLEHRDSKALLAQFGGTGEGGGAGANAGYFARFGNGGFYGKRGPASKESVHGVTLQAADFDGLLVVAVIYTGAFAENVYRTDAGAAGAENVGVENGQCRATKIALGDFLNETRNVNVGGASGGARRVEAVKAAIGFSDRGLIVERGVDFRKASEEIGSTERMILHG